MILSDNSAPRLISRATQAADWLQTLPQHTWYVGAGVHRNATFTAQRSRNWLPHAFGLRARLRAFSFGYRVLPIPNRKGQSPKSSKSAASGYRRRPTRGGTTGSKRHYYLLPRYARHFPIGRRLLADDFGVAENHQHRFAAEAKSSGATPAQSGRTTAKLGTSQVLTIRAAPTFPEAPSALPWPRPSAHPRRPCFSTSPKDQ